MKELPFPERLRQRTRLYSGRLLRSGTGGLSRPCVYMHVPKCGGTSVSEALYATVPLHHKIGILDARATRRALALHHLGVDDVSSFHDEGDRAEEAAAFREQLFFMYLAQDCRLIHGHFLLSDRIWEHAQDRYGFVSILRDPLARTVSNYRMAHRNGIFPGDFDAFLDSAMGRRMALHVLRFFSGQTTIPPEEVAPAMDRARARMAGFALIGMLEDLDGFSRRFAEEFGARLSIPHYNRGTGPDLDITPDQRRKLEALCAPDIELTERARAGV